MKGRGGKGKGLKELMLQAARQGFSGVPVWASEQEVEAVCQRHPEIYGKKYYTGGAREDEPLKPFAVGKSGGLGGSRAARLCSTGMTDAPLKSLTDASSSHSGLRRAQVSDAPDAPYVEGEESSSSEEGLLRQGLSVARAAGGDKRQVMTVSECYAVRSGFVRDICFRLQATPEVDLFADAGNKRFPIWYVEGGVGPNAFLVRWTRDKLYWCNPPFSLLDAVVRKVKEDQCRMILVCPDWRDRWFFQAVQPHVVRRFITRLEVTFLSTQRWTSQGQGGACGLC